MQKKFRLGAVQLMILCQFNKQYQLGKKDDDFTGLKELGKVR